MGDKYFKNIDVQNFWQRSDYAKEEYTEAYPTLGIIKSVENELGYKLPPSYIALMKVQNGGIVINSCFPTTQKMAWADDYIAITGIMGIGKTKTYALCGNLGSQFMIDEWGYPQIGICICDCPSAGHDMIMLDYSKCGKNGEPEVVHVDQEDNYKKTFLSNNFETFIEGLVNEDVYDNSAQELIDTLEIFKTGNFSTIIQAYFKKDETINFDKVLRALFAKLTKKKGYFALHADELSYLAYDIQFYLLSINMKIETREDFIDNYPPMVAIGNNEINAGGYADFFEIWFDKRVENNKIVKKAPGYYQFTENYWELLSERIKEYA